ncbi:MAG: PilZ domain-containing protein [Oscillospiraceae bacterium]|nr:PilZ domain-containing protein [Oscillospiraceae bacterium]
MGLFSKRRQKRLGQDLTQYSGMRMEAYDERGQLLFVARTIASRDGSMVLRPLTEARLKGFERKVPVRLRGYGGKEKGTVELECTLTARGDGGWSVENVKLADKKSDRSFFRQETEYFGEVVPMRQNDIRSVPCRLVNISSHGVCISTQEEFKPGDRLLLTSRILKEWELTPLMCVVRRGTRKRGLYEYGCEFVDLTDQMESIITRAIMEMQVNNDRDYF